MLMLFDFKIFDPAPFNRLSVFETTENLIVGCFNNSIFIAQVFLESMEWVWIFCFPGLNKQTPALQ